jgi:co-chaperonin GroES (HSP10)
MIRVPKNIVAIIPIFDPEGWGLEHAARPGTKAVLADGEVVEFKARAVELYKPDGEKERSDQGIVKYVGEEAAKHGFLVGQYVLYSGYTGTLINLEGEGRLILMPFKFVQAELTEPENIEIPGLHIYNPTTFSYELATYESALQWIADEFSRLNLALKVKTRRPSREEYNEEMQNKW